ncbi:MAG: TetR/AcrR family transcriptional regulator [Mycobacterium sp.]
MVAGLGEAMSVKGFAGTTVADIIERAKVSKQTFYEHYDSKQACFMDAFTRIHEKLDESSSSVSPGATPMEALDSILTKYLDVIARNATMARLYLIEVYAAGPDALRIRMELQQHTAEQMVMLFGLYSDDGRFACRAVVAAISALVTHELIIGGADGVRDLHAPLMVLTGHLIGALSGD